MNRVLPLYDEEMQYFVSFSGFKMGLLSFDTEVLAKEYIGDLIKTAGYAATDFTVIYGAYRKVKLQPATVIFEQG